MPDLRMVVTALIVLPHPKAIAWVFPVEALLPYGLAL
jgi:hypothetical protein